MIDIARTFLIVHPWDIHLTEPIVPMIALIIELTIQLGLSSLGLFPWMMVRMTR